MAIISNALFYADTDVTDNTFEGELSPVSLTVALEKSQSQHQSIKYPTYMNRNSGPGT